MPSFKWKSIVQYVSLRERGGETFGGHQAVPNILTSTRNMKPIIAATPSECRSTYLLRLNSNNNLLAAAHGDRSVAIYYASTGVLLARCSGHQRSPWTLAFHPSQPHLLASGCLGGSIRLWNLECLASVDENTPTEPRQLLSTKVWKHTGAIASLAFHPNHSILVAAWSQEVVFYDWVSGRKLSVWRFVANHSRVRWVRFSPDGSLLYTATANPSIVQPQYSQDQDAQTRFSTTDSKMTKPINNESIATVERNQTAVQSSTISRDALLPFLVTRPDSWFQQLGICSACPVRLCRWAGALGPEFPSSKVDPHRGVSTISQVVQSVVSNMRLAGLPLSHILQELMLLDSSEALPETSQHLSTDANPAAVAIIEDMPVREFLLSRGNYCPAPSTVVSDGGLCCGGHACDLVLAHRDLMRYSVCRPCLAVFWRWASRHVSWWHWSKHVVESGFLPKSKPVSLTPRLLQDTTAAARSFHDSKHRAFTPNHQTACSPTGMVNTIETQSAVGVCIRCYAGANASISEVQNDVPSSRSMETSSANVHSFEPSQHCISVAALELLQSRLGKANDVTQVTYMAPELVTAGVLSKRIAELLETEACVTSTTKHLPKSFLYLLQRATLAHGIVPIESPSPKRRKITQGDSGRHAVTQRFAANPSMDSVEIDEHAELSCNAGNSLAEQAASFGLLMLDALGQTWNKPSRVEIRNSHTVGANVSTSRLELFPYVPTGTRLLRPTISADTFSEPPQMGICSTPIATSKSTGIARNESEENLRTLDQPDFDGVNGRSMTACCRCGHIVPQTFHIDPQSSLSAAVCEDLVLSDDQYHATNTLSARQEHSVQKRQSPTPGSSSSVQANTSCPDASLFTATCGATNIPVLSSFGSASFGANFPANLPSASSKENTASDRQLPMRGPGSMFDLINQTNADSMLHTMNRRITEAIAGLFINMGEHGSANNLQETTYRVCRWELNLRGSIQIDYTRCSPKKLDRLVTTDEVSLPRQFLPMPANMAVSYNKSSLVIPHARLFNDSSICLSPDGRMMAAFVTPQLHCNRSSNVRSSDAPGDAVGNNQTSGVTILAVYRLQPRSSRGQCLFARRFKICTPVCLDFSPLSDYLAVGMATSRLPSVALPASSLRRLTGSGLILDASADHSDLLGVRSSQVPVHSGTTPLTTTHSNTSIPVRHAFIAKIFHLEREIRYPVSRNSNDRVVRRLRESVCVPHPGLSNPISATTVQSADQSVSEDDRDRWHRLLLSSPSGISLNTIVWNPLGGLFYGTTKGLVVLMKTQPDFSSDLGPSSLLTPSEMSYEEENSCTSRTKHSPSRSILRPPYHAKRFVQFAQTDNISL